MSDLLNAQYALIINKAVCSSDAIAVAHGHVCNHDHVCNS